MKIFSWPAVGIAFAVALLLFIVGGTAYEMKPDHWSEADIREMRAFRVSLLSDDQIRQLHADAIAEAARLKNIDRADQEKSEKDRTATAQRCADVVY